MGEAGCSCRGAECADKNPARVGTVDLEYAVWLAHRLLLVVFSVRHSRARQLCVRSALCKYRTLEAQFASKIAPCEVSVT